MGPLPQVESLQLPEVRGRQRRAAAPTAESTAAIPAPERAAPSSPAPWASPIARSKSARFTSTGSRKVRPVARCTCSRTVAHVSPSRSATSIAATSTSRSNRTTGGRERGGGVSDGAGAERGNPAETTSRICRSSDGVGKLRSHRPHEAERAEQVHGGSRLERPVEGGQQVGVLESIASTSDGREAMVEIPRAASEAPGEVAATARASSPRRGPGRGRTGGSSPAAGSARRRRRAGRGSCRRGG